MPEVRDTTVPHEILIRFDEAGAVQGAHKIDRRVVVIDGETIMNDVGPAVGISIDDADDPHSVWGAVTAGLSTAAEQASERRKQLAPESNA